MTAAGAILLAVAGFFSVERAADGHWQVRDPEGRPFVIRGVDHATYRGHYCAFDKRHHYEEANRRDYPTREAWNAETAARLKRWGFNTLASGCDAALRHRGLNYAFLVWIGQGFCAQGGKGASLTGLAEGCGKAFPNVYATNFVSWCEAWARRNCAPLKDDRTLVGYFLDNELNFGFLEGLPVEKRREVAERYFAVTTAAIRKADPNHLILGCRFCDRVPEALESAGRHCDIVSLNCYPWADLDRNVVLTSRKPGARRVAEAFADWSKAAGGKPLLVTEWSYPALDSGLPCTGGAGMRVATQAERAAASELFARTMIASPHVVGYDYFMWVDEPRLGMSPAFREDSNYGLVSEEGRPYRELTEMFTRLHAEVETGRPMAMPRERMDAEPYLVPFETALGRFGWAGQNAEGAAVSPEPPRLVRTGKAWRVENADGLVLEGSFGGAFVKSVSTRKDGRLGSVHAMIECKVGGKRAYCDLRGVIAVTNRTEDGLLRLVETAEGVSNSNRFHLTCEIVVPEKGTSFALNVKEIKNLGPRNLEVIRVYARQMAAFHREKMPSPPLMRNLWHSPLADGWNAKDGRYFGAMTRAPMADAVYYWNGSGGEPHPDAMFVPPERLELKAGETWNPSDALWVRFDCAVPDWKPTERWRGFNLLGMFRCPTVGLKPDPRVDGHFNEWEFQALHDWGFNFARLPIDYRILITGDDWTNLSEAKMKLVDQAIGWGAKYGIHVQVALHRIPGYCILDQTEAFPLGTSAVAQEAACRMWAAFAKRWKAVPNETLSFNLFNEPTRHTAGKNYPPLVLKLIAAIRAEDPKRFVMVDGNDCASKPVSEIYPIPAVGQAFRGYTPHAITHYGADYIGGIPKDPPTWPLAPNYGTAWVRTSPEETLALYLPALAAGEVCMVGEFGARNRTPHSVTLAWMEHCLRLWKKHNLGWALWNLRGVIGILDSDRADVRYEDYRGHRLDRQMLDLLRRY